MKKIFLYFMSLMFIMCIVGCSEKEDITNYVTFPKQWSYGDTSSIAGYPIILNYKNNHSYKLEIFEGSLLKNEICLTKVFANEDTVEWILLYSGDDFKYENEHFMNITIYKNEKKIGFATLKLYNGFDENYYKYKIECTNFELIN